MPAPNSLAQMRRSVTNLRRTPKQQLLLQSLDLVRNLLLLWFILRYTRKVLVHLRGYGLLGSLRKAWRDGYRKAYAAFLRLPIIQSRVRADISTALQSLETKLVPSGPGVTSYTSIPASGWSPEQISAELDKLSEMHHTRWEDGRVSGAVYHGGEELSDLQGKAFRRFGVANPIHPDVFPGVRKMEAEVVGMCLALFHAPTAAAAATMSGAAPVTDGNAGSESRVIRTAQAGAGVTTSGGTESILMAVLAARQKASHERSIREPEMILPETAHTAFRKAGEYFGIHIHLVACPGPSYRADTKRIARLINRNTILLVGSAPNFPHGIVDDIPSLSRLALKHKLPLHVDCCLGSFVIPFLSRAGFPAPEFDFRLPGVTSISVDTHKYGFAPKGNSVVLYRSAELRKYQYYVCPDWSGGVYASPGMAGSRPGALIAGCWASLMRMGEDGYLDSCLKIVGARQRIEEAIREKEGLKRSLSVIGKPLVSVVAFRAAEVADAAQAVDIYDVADGMSGRGWHLNALQDPPAMHVAVTIPVAAVVEELIRDLEVVVAECKGKAGGKKGDAAALYGVAGALPDKSIVRELAGGFLDCLYMT